MKPLTPMQRHAIQAANAKGNIGHTYGGPRYNTLKALERKGLVTVETWSTWGALRPERGKAWDANLTEEGWKVYTVMFALTEYDWELDPKDVVMIDGAPTIDGMDPKEWLEAQTME